MKTPDNRKNEASKAAFRTTAAAALFLICRRLGNFLAQKEPRLPASPISYIIVAIAYAAFILLWRKFSRFKRARGTQKINRSQDGVNLPKIRLFEILASVAAILAFDAVLSGCAYVFAGAESISALSGYDVMAALILYPTSEEIFFRGMLTSVLMPHTASRESVSYAVIVQALLFGAAHNPSSIPTAILAGLLFGKITVRSGRKTIIPIQSIAAHVMYNGAVCLAQTVAAQIASPAYGATAEFASAFIFGAMSIISLRRYGGKKLHND